MNQCCHSDEDVVKNKLIHRYKMEIGRASCDKGINSYEIINSIRLNVIGKFCIKEIENGPYEFLLNIENDFCEGEVRENVISLKDRNYKYMSILNSHSLRLSIDNLKIGQLIVDDKTHDICVEKVKSKTTLKINISGSDIYFQTRINPFDLSSLLATITRNAYYRRNSNNKISSKACPIEVLAIMLTIRALHYTDDFTYNS